MNQPILSIIIPTYNRPEQIKKQVENILPQLSSDVKFIIRDNCSPIPVKSLFSPTELDLIHIERNLTNIGGAANIARCIELCETEWVWILGDDDYITSDAINRVLEKINKNRDDIWLNFECSLDLKIEDPKVFYQSLSSLTEFSNSFWISKCIYNISKLRPYIKAYYESLSSMIGQLALLLSYAIETNQFKGHKFKQNIFTEHEPGKWNFSDFIKRTSLIFLNYSKYKKSLLRPAFKGLTLHRLFLLQPTQKGQLRLFWKIISEYGIINSFVDMPKKILKTLLILSFPKHIK